MPPLAWFESVSGLICNSAYADSCRDFLPRFPAAIRRLSECGQMVDFEELKKMIRRNMFLGMWAAEQLGLTGEKADAYAKALSVGTLDPEGRDVFGIIRKDFDAAGIVQSDEQILDIMQKFTLQAGDPNKTTGSGDAGAVMIARNLSKGR